MDELKAEHGGALAATRAIGLSGQMHGATLLDARGAVLRPAILWNDGRSGAECAALEAAVPDARRITGNLAMPGFTAPKLLWVAAHEPEVFARVAKVLLPKDYLRYRLSGEHVAEMSDASGTLWLDVANRRWSEEMLAATGLDLEQMPRLVEGSEPSAVLTPALARRWGMTGEVVIAGGAGDNAAGAAGIGTVAPGRAFLSLGTSGVLFAANRAYAPNPERAVHAFCHCFPDTWHQMSVILSAAASLAWAAGVTGTVDEAALVDEAEATEARLERAPLFLPYLTGERTPHNDPHAKGVFFGLDQATSRGDLGWAVLEGVAFAFADGYDALVEAGTGIDEVSVIGGGSRSAVWGRILAAALARPLTYHAGSEVGPALGAARLARLAATGERPGEVCHPTSRRPGGGAGRGPCRAARPAPRTLARSLPGPSPRDAPVHRRLSRGATGPEAGRQAFSPAASPCFPRRRRRSGPRRSCGRVRRPARSGRCRPCGRTSARPSRR